MSNYATLTKVAKNVATLKGKLRFISDALRISYSVLIRSQRN